MIEVSDLSTTDGLIILRINGRKPSTVEIMESADGKKLLIRTRYGQIVIEPMQSDRIKISIK